MRPQLRLPALADAAQGPLAGGIGRRRRRALHARGGRDIHDVPLAALLHRRNDAIRQIHQPEDVGVEHLLHFRDVERADLATIGVAGVVDEDVDATHAFIARVDGSRVLVGYRDVGLQADGAGLSRHRVDELLVAAGEHDLVPGLARQFDNRRADPLTAPGDQKTRWLHERDSSYAA